MAEAQTPVHPPSLPIAVQFGALRQPHFHIALPEVHRSIVNNRVIAQKADFRQWCDQIRLHANDLVAVRRDPGSPPQGHGEGWTILSKFVCSDGVWLVRPLTEMDLPCQMS